jgi:cell division septation protein DedD
VGRALHPHFLAALCAATALLAAGCGDRSNLIPQSRAADLSSQLDDIKAAIDAGRCDGLSAKVATFHDDATSLPKTVDRRLRSRINQGVKSLQAHAAADCRDNAAADEQPSDTTPSDTTPSDTTPSDTTPSNTTPTDTTPTDTTPTDTTPTDTTPTDTTPNDGDTGGTGDGGTGGTDDGSGQGSSATPSGSGGGGETAEVLP